MYTIAHDKNDIVIRFNENSIDKKALTNFLEFIELEQIRKNSKLTEVQIQTLSREINQKEWSQLKNKVLKTV